MQLDVVTAAEPPDIQRLVVVVMMGVHPESPADLAALPFQLAGSNRCGYGPMGVVFFRIIAPPSGLEGFLLGHAASYAKVSGLNAKGPFPNLQRPKLSECQRAFAKPTESFPDIAVSFTRILWFAYRCLGHGIRNSFNAKTQQGFDRITIAGL